MIRSSRLMLKFQTSHLPRRSIRRQTANPSDFHMTAPVMLRQAFPMPPPVCRYGDECHRKDCYFSHPDRDGVGAASSLVGAVQLAFNGKLDVSAAAHAVLQSNFATSLEQGSLLFP